jgi:cytochrome c1
MLSRGANIAVALIALAVVGAAGATAALEVRDRQKQTHRAVAVTGGNPKQALGAIVRFGCASCHAIPGAHVPGGLTAPPLSGIASRLYLGGAVENTPTNLVLWIVNPKQFSPRTAMPVTGISEREARNVAAYLLSMN